MTLLWDDAPTLFNKGVGKGICLINNCLLLLFLGRSWILLFNILNVSFFQVHVLTRERHSLGDHAASTASRVRRFSTIKVKF